MKQTTKFKQTEIGEIPEDWEIVNLGVYTLKIGSGITPRGGNSVYINQGVALIRSQNVYNYGFSESGLVFITDIQSKDMENVSLEENDILLNITGDSVARCCLVPMEFLPARVNQHVMIIRVRKELNPKFVRYYLITPKTQALLLSLADSGGTRKALTKTMLENLPVVKPDLSEQFIIAKILSDLDSKIELNQKMNRNLEAIGQNLFRHWFVDFEFPNEKGKPYKSSGGEMVESELGEIPKGWKVSKLNEAADFIRGFSYRGSEKNQINGTYAFVTLNSVIEGGGFKREFCFIMSERLKDRHFVKQGDIIIPNTEQTKTGTLLGFPALVEFPLNYGKERGVFSHHITKAIPKEDNLRNYLYLYLFLNQQNAVKYHTGSVIWALDVEGWSKNEFIILPEYSTLGKFNLLLDKVFKDIFLNHFESESLAQTRDLLLPKLMSGKIRVTK